MSASSWSPPPLPSYGRPHTVRSQKKACANSAVPLKALWSCGERRQLGRGNDERCHQHHRNSPRRRRLGRHAPKRQARSSLGSTTLGCRIDRSLRQRRARRERRNEKGEAKERAESQRSDFSRYGAILTSTRGGFCRSAQPRALHALLIAAFSAASTLRPQRNFTPTQPTR